MITYCILIRYVLKCMLCFDKQHKYKKEAIH